MKQPHKRPRTAQPRGYRGTKPKPKPLSLSHVPYIPEDTEFDYNEWHHPDSRIARSIDDFGALLASGISHSNLTPDDKLALATALGINTDGVFPDHMTLGNLRLRTPAYRALYDALRAQWHTPSTPNRRWFSITMFGDIGNSLEYHTVIELHRARRDFAKILARIGLHAVAVLELQAGTNYPGDGYGRTIELHTHGIGFTDDPTFNARQVSRQLSRRAVLSNWLGASTVRIDPLPTLSRLRKQAAYMLKAPISASRLVTDQGTANGLRRVNVAIDRPSLALRLAETLLHISYEDAVFATGKGGLALKRSWLGGLREHHRSHPHADPGDPAALFQRLWASGRYTCPRAPIDVRRDTAQPEDAAWHQAMTKLLTKIQEHRDAQRTGAETLKTLRDTLNAADL